MYNDYKGIVFYSNQHFSDVSLVLNKKFKSNSGHTVSKRRIATGVLIDNQRVNQKHKFHRQIRPSLIASQNINQWVMPAYVHQLHCIEFVQLKYPTKVAYIYFLFMKCFTQVIDVC